MRAGVDALIIFLTTRFQASDPKSTTRLATTVSDLAYQARNYSLLNTNILLLSKKHGQLKATVQAMVEQAMNWLDDVKNNDGLERWLEFVETLRQVTEGKVRSYISLEVYAKYRVL